MRQEMLGDGSARLDVLADSGGGQPCRWPPLFLLIGDHGRRGRAPFDGTLSAIERQLADGQHHQGDQQIARAPIEDQRNTKVMASFRSILARPRMAIATSLSHHVSMIWRKAIG